MYIAYKEANETEYWLELLYESGYIETKAFESMYSDCKELIKILASITKHKKEILTKYKCYYDEGTNSLNILITQDLCFADFTKEIMMNLLEMSQKLCIETIYFLVAKKNPQYIKFVQDLMIIGFEVDTNTKTVNIEGNVFKVLKLQVKDQDDEIEEVF